MSRMWMRSVHRIYGLCILKNICYMHSVRSVHTFVYTYMVRNVERETEIILVCGGIVAYFGLEHSIGTIVSFAFAITKLHTWWCLCMPSFGELLHFNVELPSMHHSNFNYIIQMTLQIGAHVKNNNNAFMPSYWNICSFAVD